MREIGREGRVWRLTKASWDFLRNYDSDPNEALKKIQAQMSAKPAPATFSASSQTPASHGCNFNEKTLKETIKSTMEEVLRPFMGS